jgi:hypothetical protein
MHDENPMSNPCMMIIVIACGIVLGVLILAYCG